MVALSGNDLGIVTSTDIRDKIAATERDPKTTLVREIMTTPVITAHPDMSLNSSLD
jgi:CBS domain-containing protein